MKNVTLTKHVQIRLTAEQWDLYTNDPRQALAAAQAADAINQAIEEAFNEGQTREAVEATALLVMKRCADQGAMDTEPLGLLEMLLDELFGDNRSYFTVTRRRP